jgi:glutamine amidotransferase
MIAVIDYQMGNLRSVQKALERVGHEAVVTSDPEDVARADKIVLPGVGAFEDAIAELRRRELVGPIVEAIDRGKPFLGICLGLQLLFDVSYEGGRHEGLGVLPGEVVRFDLPPEFKVPHMGWNQANVVRAAPALAGIPQGRIFTSSTRTTSCRRTRELSPLRWNTAVRSARQSGATTFSPRSSIRKRASAMGCSF